MYVSIIYSCMSVCEIEVKIYMLNIILHHAYVPRFVNVGLC